MLIRAKVDFRKPDLVAIRHHGMTPVDMHVHTQYSDAYIKIPKLLARADKLGIGLAITDHNEIAGALEAHKLKDDHLLIPGIEVTCFERCHMLLYFYSFKDLKSFFDVTVAPYRSANPYSITKVHTAELLRSAKDYDGIVCAAHPFAAGYTGIYKSIARGYLHKDVLEHIDAFEVMNGTVLKNMNWKALHWAEHQDKAFTGGSDSHSLFEVGKVVTYSDAHSVRGFLDRIRQRRNFVMGKQLGLIAHMPSSQRILRKHLRYFRPTIRMRYETTVKQTIKHNLPRIERRLKTRLDKVKDASNARIEVAKELAQRGVERINHLRFRFKP